MAYPIKTIEGIARARISSQAFSARKVAVDVVILKVATVPMIAAKIRAVYLFGRILWCDLEHGLEYDLERGLEYDLMRSLGSDRRR